MSSRVVPATESYAPQHGRANALRRCRAVLLAAALVAALFCSVLTRADTAWAGSWTSRTSGVTSNLYGVTFADTSHGWAVGTIGTILATTDGGTTWKAQVSGVASPLYGVAHSDASHAWAVGPGGVILATTNGGATWTAQSSGTAADLYGVTFVDANHGWAVGAGGTILATVDGGTTWTAQTSGTGNLLRGVAFADAAHGWAVGVGGTILATIDGGATWTAQTATPASLAYLYSVTCTDSSHAWAVGMDVAAGMAGAVLTTSNGGSSWTNVGSGATAPLFGVDFTDPGHGWAVGGGLVAGPLQLASNHKNTTASPYGTGVIVASADGGLTWGGQSTGANMLTDVAFTDVAHGWAVGASGAILAYRCATPTVTISGADDAWHAKPVNLLVAATVDSALSTTSLQYSTNGGTSWADIPGSGATRQLQISTQGQNSVLVRVTDSASQTSQASATVKIDGIRPQIRVLGIRGTWQRGPVALTFKPTVGPSGVSCLQYRLGHGSWKTVTKASGRYRATVDFQGSKRVRYRVTNHAGTTSVLGNSVLKIDNDAPSLQLAGTSLTVQSGSDGKLSVKLLWSDRSSHAQLFMRVTQHHKRQASWSRVLTRKGHWQTVSVPCDLASGRYSLHFVLYDVAGNHTNATASLVALP